MLWREFGEEAFGYADRGVRHYVLKYALPGDVALVEAW